MADGLPTYAWAKHDIVPEDILRHVAQNLGTLMATGDSHPKSGQTAKLYEDVITTLILTAEDGNISPGHRAAACNVLCSVLESCAASNQTRLQELAVKNAIGLRLFKVYLEHYEEAKAKSMRQVLNTFSRLLSKSESEELSKRNVLSTLFATIFEQRERAEVKPKLQALAFLLAKETVNVDHLLDTFATWQQERGYFSQGTIDFQEILASEFLTKILDWVSCKDVAPAAGRVVAVFCSRLMLHNLPHSTHKNNVVATPFWVIPLVNSVLKNPEAIENFRNYVLPPLFKFDLSYLRVFLQHLQESEHPQSAGSSTAASALKFRSRGKLLVLTSLYLAALQVANELGLIRLIDKGESELWDVSEDIMHLQSAPFGQLLATISQETRIAALSLLVNSQTGTAPFSGQTLLFLKKHLSHLHADADARFRSELLGLTRRLTKRLRAALATLSKNRLQCLNTSTKSNPPVSKPLQGRRGTHEDGETVYASHAGFIEWYLSFLMVELRPTASYQRLITASKALAIVIRSGLDPCISDDALSKGAHDGIQWPFKRRIITPDLVRILLDLVLNSFDDIRQIATSILEASLPASRGPETGPAQLTIESNGTGLTQHVPSADHSVASLERAMAKSLCSGRADHADGVARQQRLLFVHCDDSNLQYVGNILPSTAWWTSRLTIVDRLVDNLKKAIDISMNDLSLAVQQYPIHGILLALRYIIDHPGFYDRLLKGRGDLLDAWKGIHTRLYDHIRSIWGCVRHILCSDAPEGYMPEDFEDDMSFTTKDVLSYSWRALKEASILLSVIVTKTPYHEGVGLSFLGNQDIRSLGDLCFVQLSELRHRGAFSTVAHAFASCCARCMNVKAQELEGFVLGWYNQLLRRIQSKGSILTRRSAGIPALLTGILSAQPGPDLFQRAMHDLLRVAREHVQVADVRSNHLPQVHAMNCLKAIFTATNLGETSDRYIGAGLKLAASRLSSDIWAIRNCGLMLLRALIDRLLGTNWSQDYAGGGTERSSRLSYSRYPDLLDIVIRLLQSGQQIINAPLSLGSTANSILPSMIVEGVFPALEIIRRAPPPESHYSILLPLIRSVMGSAQWHLRDLAARTYATLIEPEQRTEEIHKMIRSTWDSQNTLHGQLLCTKYLLQKHLKTRLGADDDTSSLLHAVCKQYGSLCAENPCPFTRAVYLDLLNALVASSFEKNEEGVTLSVVNQHDILSNTAEKLMVQQLAVDSNSSMTSQDRATLSTFTKSGLVFFALCELASSTSQGGLQSTPHSQFQNLITANVDIALEAFQIVEQACTSGNLTRVSGHFRKFCSRLLAATNDQRLRLAVLDAQIRNIAEERWRGSAWVASQELEDLSQVPIRDLLIQSSNSPSNVEQIVRIWGACVCAKRYAAGMWTTPLCTEAARWVLMLRALGEDRNEFSVRLAGAVSMKRFGAAWSIKPKLPDALFIGACLALYDALNDDDEEVRDTAAVAAKGVLATSSKGTIDSEGVVPLVASQRISEHLASKHRTSRHLFRAATSRLLGIPLSRARPIPSVRELLQEASKENYALFAEEKQNLFVDEARENVIWSRVLMSLSEDAMDIGLVTDFQMWVTEGLDVLTGKAKNERDGPLGWTSKPEVFVLGLRVIYGAKVLLNWTSRTGKVTATPVQILTALRCFADVGEKRELHGLWMDQVKVILAEAVSERLTSVKEHMDRVLGAL